MTSRSRARLARLGMALTSGVLVTSLAGCALLPVLNSALGRRDFSHLLREEDSPDGTALIDGGGREDVEEMSQFVDSNWYDFGGIPSTCVANYGTSFLVTELDSELTDPIVDLGSFDYDYERDGQLRASARVFDDSAAAVDFLDYVTTASEACVTGYTLTSADPQWHIVHVETADADGLDLPEGIVGLYHEETAYELMQLSYRDTFLRYENIVVVIGCEVHVASPFDFEDCDRVAEAIAQRLAAVDY